MNQLMTHPLVRAVRDFFTSHLLAKFFAVSLAILVVYLVDREIKVAWIEEEGLDVILSANAGANEKRQRRVVLDPLEDVAILGFPDTITVTIIGSDKDRHQFDKFLDLRVPVRREWANATEPVAQEHPLVASNIEIPYKSAQVKILGNPKVQVDLFAVAADVQVDVVSPTNIPSDAKAIVTPRVSKVSVRGPRSVLKSRGFLDRSGRIRMTVIESGRLDVREAPHRQRAVLSTVYAPDQITLSGDSSIEVDVKVTPVEPRLFVVDRVPIRFVFEREHLDAIVQDRKLRVSTAAIMFATVTVRGTPSIIDQVASPEGKQSLRQAIQLQIRPGPSIESGDTTGDLEVGYSGMPAGLEVESINPARIPILIERPEKKKD